MKLGAIGAADAKRLRPERGAKPPSESERGWGPASIKKCAMGAVFVLVTVDVYAQAPRGPAVEQYLDRENGMTLSDAIAGALEREPDLRAARAEIEIARGMRRQAGL